MRGLDLDLGKVTILPATTIPIKSLNNMFSKWHNYKGEGHNSLVSFKQNEWED